MADLDLAAAVSRTAMPCPPTETVWVSIRRRGITAHKLPAGPDTTLPPRTDCGRTVRGERGDSGAWAYGQTLTASGAADQLQAEWCRKCNWTGEPTK